MRFDTPMQPRRVMRYVLAAGLALAGGFVLFLAALYLLLPDPARLQTESPDTTAFIQQRCGTPPCHLRWTPIDQISPFLPEAVILAEDPRFFQHHGIDWQNVRHALRANIHEGRIVWGGSSITMQLAKNLYLDPEKTFWRKLREVLLAIKLERTLSKERILELYLNVAEWGPDLFGVGNAAGHYFHKTPRELTPYEAAFLASILPNPELVAHGEMPERFADAGSRIFGRLVEYHLGLTPIGKKAGAECSARLSKAETFRLKYLIAKIFDENAEDILSGTAASMTREELYASLTPDERTFIDGLLARYSDTRPIVPIACDRDTGPGMLTAFDQTNILGTRKVFWVPAGSVEDLKRLLTAAAKDGVFLQINSAWRAEGYQIFVLLSQLMRDDFCLSVTVQRVAHPMESEHGCTDELAVDLGDATSMSSLEESDAAYQWLKDNAKGYHFSLSYPAGGGIMAFEPWHWRHKVGSSE